MMYICIRNKFQFFFSLSFFSFWLRLQFFFLPTTCIKIKKRMYVMLMMMTMIIRNIIYTFRIYEYINLCAFFVYNINKMHMVREEREKK